MANAAAVSIPSSSGHQFTVMRWWLGYRASRFPFQSLLHQGISLLCNTTLSRTRPCASVSIPSSSGHQFTEFQHPLPGLVGGVVSIPSSSGHQFTESGTGFIQIDNKTEFQSLLHQGISLLPVHAGVGVQRHVGFQSLLHQGISLLPGMDCILAMHGYSFQSLLHQGISLLDGVDGCQERLVARVSIPSSSGHQFTGGEQTGISARSAFDSFQSLLHQGISLLAVTAENDVVYIQGFNPFFIRASVYCLFLNDLEGIVDTSFQSLLHQGISLL